MGEPGLRVGLAVADSVSVRLGLAVIVRVCVVVTERVLVLVQDGVDCVAVSTLAVGVMLVGVGLKLKLGVRVVSVTESEHGLGDGVLEALSVKLVTDGLADTDPAEGVSVSVPEPDGRSDPDREKVREGEGVSEALLE